MSQKPKIPLHVVTFKFENSFDKVHACLRLYAEATNIKAGYVHIRPRMVDVLTFYILYGYSRETKKKILETTGFTKENLNQINSELTKKGYLRMDSRNYRIKHLSPTVQGLKDFFDSSEDIEKSLFAFSLKREE